MQCSGWESGADRSACTQALVATLPLKVPEKAFQAKYVREQHRICRLLVVLMMLELGRRGAAPLYQAYIARGIRWHVGGAALYKVYIARSIRWRAGGGALSEAYVALALALYAEYCTEDLPPRPVGISGAQFAAEQGAQIVHRRWLLDMVKGLPCYIRRI